MFAVLVGVSDFKLLNEFEGSVWGMVRFVAHTHTHARSRAMGEIPLSYWETGGDSHDPNSSSTPIKRLSWKRDSL